MTYSTFIHGLAAAGVELDRKVLADLAVNDPGAFASLAQTAKGGLEAEAKPKRRRRTARSEAPA